MDYKNIAVQAVKSSFAPAVRTAWWIVKMMIPITFAISCLSYMGIIDYIAHLFEPVFSMVGLPGSSSVVFITASLSNLYSAVAAIATLGFDYRSVTILAVMGLICHNLIIETVIQRKAGASAPMMVCLRIVAAFMAAAAMNFILPEDYSGRLFLPQAGVVPTSWSEVITSWLATTLPLTLKMVVIIILLNILQSLFRAFRIMDLLSYPLQPFMAVFGLPRSTSFLWIICNVIGLAYGGAALVSEIEKGYISKSDSTLLNTHVAISHSLLEDTIIFFSIGIALWWLLLPRLILAIIAVWIMRLAMQRFPTYEHL